MEIPTYFKGGGSFVGQKPQFSSSSETVFVAWSNRILSYNTKTGKLLAEYRGIKDSIVGFAVHYYDSFECISACSTSGELITWKVATHFKILNKNIGRSRVKTFNVLPGSDETKALISYKNGLSTSFILYDLENDSIQTYQLKISKGPYYHVTVGKSYFAVAELNQLHCVRLHDFSKVSRHKVDKNRPLTCISSHPEDEIVLTGDSSGRILMWQNIFASMPTQSVHHWHNLPVKCVSFSVAGSYFCSGGDECVLVKWQTDSNLEKKFLPRIPASIEHVAFSSNSHYVAIATSDNAVRIVDERFDKVSLIQHLVIGDQFESGIIFDPRTKALVMNGNVGYVQFYSPSDGNLLYNVDVVGENRISNEREHQISRTQVTKIAISKTGSWMATVEERPDTEYTPDLRLKFWNFDAENQVFKLNTSIESPHEKKINAIQFQPSKSKADLKCVTVGDDQCFKVWQLVDATTIDQKGKAWKCYSCVTFRKIPCKALAFCADGSLVAVSFGEIATTWQTDSCELKCSLVNTLYKSLITHLQFGVANQCHLLVAAGNGRLSVWNLLTLRMTWTVLVDPDFLILDTITTNMAVISQTKKLYVFNPSSPDLIYSSDIVLKEHSKIYAAAFIPSKSCNDNRLKWYQRSPIFFIDSKRKLFCVGGDEELTDTTPEYVEEDASVFSKLQPKLQSGKDEPVTSLKHWPVTDLGQKNIKTYLESPIHTMIPVRLLCGELLKSMVLQKPEQKL